MSLRPLDPVCSVLFWSCLVPDRQSQMGVPANPRRPVRLSADVLPITCFTSWPERVAILGYPHPLTLATTIIDLTD